MARLGAIFIAVCMVLIAGSVGAVLYLYYGFLRVEAAVIAVAVLTGLALFNAVTSRARDRAFQSPIGQDAGEMLAIGGGDVGVAHGLERLRRNRGSAEAFMLRLRAHEQALGLHSARQTGGFGLETLERRIGQADRELVDAVEASVELCQRLEDVQRPN